MAIPNMSNEEMRTALKEIEQASYNHEQWAEMLYGTLICHLAPDQRDTSGDAHRMCRFGQWYYKSGIVALERHPGFAELGIEHEHMHQYAAHLLRSFVDGVPIPIEDYERFVKRAETHASGTCDRSARTRRCALRSRSVDGNAEPHRNADQTPRATRIGKAQGARVRHCDDGFGLLFKTINDKYGHAVGDKVLIGFARYVMAHLRPFDKLFRYGGEEFLICLPDIDLQTGHDSIDRLREELGSLPHEADGKGIIHVTVSFGLTLLDPDIPVEQSIDRADKALYVAKAMGRNRAITWNASMTG